MLDSFDKLINTGNTVCFKWISFGLISNWVIKCLKTEDSKCKIAFRFFYQLTRTQFFANFRILFKVLKTT